MIIYILESLLFSLITLAWISVQSLVAYVSPIDYVIFYVQGIIYCIALILLLALKDKETTLEIKQSIFIINLCVFLFYIHVIDQCFNYNTIPSTPDSFTCTNHPHSQSYRKVLLGETPYEISCVFSSISLSFLLIQLLLSTANCTPLPENTIWADCSLFLISSMHILVTAMDPAYWYTAFLYLFAMVYILYFVAFFVVTLFFPKFQDFLLLLRVILLGLWGFACYLFLAMHTNTPFVWSFLGIYIAVMVSVLLEYFTVYGISAHTIKPKNT